MEQETTPRPRCSCCGGAMRIIKKEAERKFLGGTECKSCYLSKKESCAGCIEKRVKEAMDYLNT